jgi:hypothetical protein
LRAAILPAPARIALSLPEIPVGALRPRKPAYIKGWHHEGLRKLASPRPEQAEGMVAATVRDRIV